MVFSDVVLFLHEFYISFTILVTFFYLVFTFLFILLKAEFEGVRNITILNSTLGFSTGPLGFSTQPGDSQLARADSQLNLGILNWPVGILNSTWGFSTWHYMGGNVSNGLPLQSMPIIIRFPRPWHYLDLMHMAPRTKFGWGPPPPLASPPPETKKCVHFGLHCTQRGANQEARRQGSI